MFSLSHKKMGCCAKLQTSCNSPFFILYCDRTPSLRPSILPLAWYPQIAPDALTAQEFPALLRRERSVVDKTSWLICFFHTISPPFCKISKTHVQPLLGSLLFHPCATDTSRSKKSAVLYLYYTRKALSLATHGHHLDLLPRSSVRCSDQKQIWQCLRRKNSMLMDDYAQESIHVHKFVSFIASTHFLLPRLITQHLSTCIAFPVSESYTE